MIDDKTQIAGSIAARRSKLGAAMHNAAYAHLGLNFVYIPFAVTYLKGAISGLKALSLRGFGVSMPYKQDIMKYLDRIDPIAREIGAVNTVSNNNGFLTGYNSDWIGAVEALKEVCSVKNKRVALLGAGGAARAIAYGLHKSKAEVVIFNRTEKKARKIAKDFDIGYGGKISNLGKLEDYDVLINSTSVGFYPNANESIIDEEQIRSNKIVMDVVFNPMETLLIKLAKKKDCKVVPGYRMSIHQALFQFELYTGRKAPFKVMEAALAKALG